MADNLGVDSETRLGVSKGINCRCQNRDTTKRLTKGHTLRVNREQMSTIAPPKRGQKANRETALVGSKILPR